MGFNSREACARGAWRAHLARLRAVANLVMIGQRQAERSYSDAANAALTTASTWTIALSITGKSSAAPL